MSEEIQTEGESGSDACGWGIWDSVPTAFGVCGNVNGYLKPFTPQRGHANKTISVSDHEIETPHQHIFLHDVRNKCTGSLEK